MHRIFTIASLCAVACARGTAATSTIADAAADPKPIRVSCFTTTTCTLDCAKQTGWTEIVCTDDVAASACVDASRTSASAGCSLTCDCTAEQIAERCTTAAR